VTVQEIAKTLQLEILAGEDALQREIRDIFCCDLLSFVIGRVPEDAAWVTVMGNVNAIAVASLADIACIVLAENAQLDNMALEKAKQQDIAVLQTKLPVYQAARQIDLTAGLSDARGRLEKEAGLSG